jgi:hypothetical protein
MRAARWGLQILAAIFVAATPGVAQTEGDAGIFPFVKGTAWTYAGTVRWTSDRNHVRSSNVRWSSEVVDAFVAGDVSAALLKGGVWDLAWWSPQVQRGSYVILRMGTRFYVASDDAKTIFAAAKKSGRKALPANVERAPWFSTPLIQGRLFRPSDVAPRDDTRYGWLVETATPRGYGLSYRTLPDEEHLTLVPGIGITSFTYLHHGTVAEAHVHLIGYHRGGSK